MDEKKPIKPPAPDPDGLLPRQKQFCLRFLATGNGTASAILAGYSPKTAPSTQWELRKNPKVIAFLSSRKADWDEKLDASMMRLRAELVRTAYTAVSENPLYQMQLARIKKIDGKTEKQINKLLPTMTAEYEVLRKIVKDHELNQARAQKLLADLDNQKNLERIAERLEKIEKEQAANPSEDVPKEH